MKVIRLKMTPKDWATMRYFRAAEVARTGAAPEDVDREAMRTLDAFRARLGVAVILLHNGVTTGQHKSPGHPAGRAFDCYTATPVDSREVVIAAMAAGFRAIGVYWNGKAYSYHLEDSDGIRLWSGVRNARGGWDYGPLLQDPAKG